MSYAFASSFTSLKSIAAVKVCAHECTAPWRHPRASFETPMTRRSLLLNLFLVSAGLGSTTRTQPLDTSLSSIRMVRDALDELAVSVQERPSGDVRRIVKTLLIGSDIRRALREAATSVKGAQRADVQLHGTQALEFLDQVVSYFDTTLVRERYSPQVALFSMQAISAARDELDALLRVFDK